jgi:hypothetical protein
VFQSALADRALVASSRSPGRTSKRLGQWTRSLAQTQPNRTQVSRFPKIGQRPIPTYISEWLPLQLNASGGPPGFVV